MIEQICNELTAAAAAARTIKASVVAGIDANAATAINDAIEAVAVSLEAIEVASEPESIKAIHSV